MGRIAKLSNAGDLGSMSALETFLRIKGYATAEILAQVSGLAPVHVEAWANECLSNGYAETTRMGLRLTPSGRDKSDALTQDERAGIDTVAFGRMYEDFEGLNSFFKKLVADWQVRVIDGVETLNDHSDGSYDGVILAELDTIHLGIAPVLATATTQVSRLSRYQTRFDAALTTLKSGNLPYLAAPIIDSYHTIWFELHEDLIRLTGRSRAAEAAAGRAS